MVKQLLIPFAAVAVFIVLVGLLVKNSGNIVIPGVTSTNKTIKVGDATVQVEIANTPQTRAQGLSGRAELKGDTGMLFTFDANDKTPVFWMKDMLIPLDLVWIKDGNVVKIDKNVQPPNAGTPDSDLARYSPGQQIDQVLEVRGGYTDANKISVGSKVDLSGI